jgi:hypothetical protein
MPQNGSNSRYSVELVRAGDGVRFGRRAVPDAYLEPAREQLIFLAQRRGTVAADPVGTHVIESPVFVRGGAQDAIGEVQGIEMSLADGGSTDPLSVFFDTGLFQPFGQRVALDLINAKEIATSDDIRVRVFSDGNRLQGVESNGQAAVVRDPLPLLEGKLDALVSQAVAVGPAANGDYPVFVTAAALAQAHEFVWQRNRERGVWLGGSLHRQRHPHEIYGVVDTVFEARGTTHDRFSIDFTTETYSHVEEQLKLSRNRFGRNLVLMGFMHSHPFLPSILDGMEACPACSLRPTCKLTSSFFSQRDQAFHAAMFGSAPYAVEIVLGLTPREEFDLKMFCCDGGQFRERGYYRLGESPTALLHEGGPVT